MQCPTSGNCSETATLPTFIWFLQSLVNRTKLTHLQHDKDMTESSLDFFVEFQGLPKMTIKTSTRFLVFNRSINIKKWTPHIFTSKVFGLVWFYDAIKKKKKSRCFIKRITTIEYRRNWKLIKSTKEPLELHSTYSFCMHVCVSFSPLLYEHLHRVFNFQSILDCFSKTQEAHQTTKTAQKKYPLLS